MESNKDVLCFLWYIFRACNASSDIDITQVLNAVESKLSLQINEQLIMFFTIEEVHHALHQMHQSKAPGLNIIPVLFFKIFGILY